jgi:galactokinase
MDIRTQFLNHFNYVPLLAVQSPGRINLIGEHTDYNNGFVLPAAIDKYIQVAIGKRTDGNLQMAAIDLGETILLPIENIKPHPTQWVNYIIGVVFQVIQKLNQNKNINHASLSAMMQGFDICIQGNIPIGAGLSSSAAVECAVLFTLNELYQLEYTKIEMALMAQKAEHEFAGVQCGLMDMFASLHGQKNKVILLDCASLDYAYYPLVLNEYSIVLLDTQIKHALASSEYNTRRLECEQGLELIQKTYSQVKSLRDVNKEQVATCLGPATHTNKNIFHRCKYVVEEMERVQAAVKDLVEGDMLAFGKKMFETHQGLTNLYEVSCPELDFLVDAVQYNENVLGARMMGGGFGGCTINIIKKSAVDAISKELTAKYLNKYNKSLAVYTTSIQAGTHLLP